MMQENEEEKVIRVFERRRQKTDPKDAFNATPILIIILFCLLALIVSIVIGYKYHSSDREEISSLNERILFLEKRADMLMDKLDRFHAANSYSDRLKLSGIMVNRADNELTISGEIYNAGPRSVAEISVTIYMLDRNETIVSHDSFAYRSPDGSSLRTGQKRKFSYNVKSFPDEVKDVKAVITGVMFHQ